MHALRRVGVICKIKCFLIILQKLITNQRINYIDKFHKARNFGRVSKILLILLALSEEVIKYFAFDPKVYRVVDRMV